MEKVVIKKWIDGSFHVVAVYSSKDVKSITHHTDGLRIIFNGYIRVFDSQCVIEFRKDIVAEFKVGDWIITNDELVHKEYRVCRIERIEDDRYYISTGDFLAKNTLEEFDYHLWTIQDAKDGDILCSNQIIILFKQWEPNTAHTFVIAHAGIDISGKLQITDGHWLINNESKPATQEQRDLLFYKMKEDGYKWDFEKKELRKIEPKSACSEGDEDKMNKWNIQSEKDLLNETIDWKSTYYKVILKDGRECKVRAYADKCCDGTINTYLEYTDNDSGADFDNILLWRPVKSDYEGIVEKACEWLKNNARNYAFVDTDMIGNVADIDSSLVQDFKNYMKGE